VGSRRLGPHPETGLSSICSGTRTMQCTDRHKCPISADTSTEHATALSRWASGICRGISYKLIPNHHRLIGISTNTSNGPSCKWRLCDLRSPTVTYLMVTAEVGCSLMSTPRTAINNLTIENHWWKDFLKHVHLDLIWKCMGPTRL